MTVFLAAVLIFVSASCGKQASGNKLKNIERPDAAATTDEAERATSPEGAVEHSSNVNGARFGMSLGEFTEKYNYAIEKGEGKTRLFFANWRKSSDTETDNNGVAIQYWYYDDTDVSFTATVEVKTDRLLNIGVGTTMSRFMGTTGDQNNSDLILAKAALMRLWQKPSAGFLRAANLCFRIFFTALPPKAIPFGMTAMCSISAQKRTGTTAKTMSCCSGSFPSPTSLRKSGS